jgi:membrane associated rhomboid family serine protease
MQTDKERSTLTGNDARFSANAPSLPVTVLTFASAVVLLVVAFMFSLLAFAILGIVGLLVWGYLWWKTRELRRQMREQPPGGRVIEGEAIHDVESHDKVEC